MTLFFAVSTKGKRPCSAVRTKPKRTAAGCARVTDRTLAGVRNGGQTMTKRKTVAALLTEGKRHRSRAEKHCAISTNAKDGIQHYDKFFAVCGSYLIFIVWETKINKIKHNGYLFVNHWLAPSNCRIYPRDAACVGGSLYRRHAERRFPLFSANP